MATRNVLDRESRFVYGLATLERRGRPMPGDGFGHGDAASFSWDRAIGIAGRENAIPLLYDYVKTLPPGTLTAAQSTQVQRSTMGFAMSMSNLAVRLDEVLSIFATADIPVLLLKGAALAVTVYPSFVRRPMADIDILVQPGRAREAWTLAQSIGWTAETGRISAAFYDSHHHLPPLISTRWPGGLELHTALLPPHNPFDLSPESVWRTARTVQAGKHQVLVPSVTHLMVHACVHFTWSNTMLSAGWRTFRDLSWLISTGPVAWDDFVREAGRARATTGCYWTLRLGRALSALDVPESVLTALAPPVVDPVLRRLERFYAACLCPPVRWRVPTLRLSHMLWSLGMQPRWSGHGDARPWRSSNVFTDAPSSERVDARARQLLREIGLLVR